MEEDLVNRLHNFDLSATEKEGIDLERDDIKQGVEQCQKSLIGRIYGEKNANFTGVTTVMTNLWSTTENLRVRELGKNHFQFIFQKDEEKKKVMENRPWFFENQILILHEWTEDLDLSQQMFDKSPLWVQLWNLPNHWISKQTGSKIGKLFNKVLDIFIPESGSREGRCIKMLVECDLSKPILRRTVLRCNNQTQWVNFKYEHLPLICHYCGRIGHSIRGCSERRNANIEEGQGKEQYGQWLRASTINKGPLRTLQGKIVKEISSDSENQGVEKRPETIRIGETTENKVNVCNEVHSGNQNEVEPSTKISEDTQVSNHKIQPTSDNNCLIPFENAGLEESHEQNQELCSSHPKEIEPLAVCINTMEIDLSHVQWGLISEDLKAEAEADLAETDKRLPQSCISITQSFKPEISTSKTPGEDNGKWKRQDRINSRVTTNEIRAIREAELRKNGKRVISSILKESQQNTSERVLKMAKKQGPMEFRKAEEASLKWPLLDQ